MVVRLALLLVALVIGAVPGVAAAGEYHALIDFRQGLSGWTSFGAIVIPHNEDGYDDAKSLEVINRTASWNGALYELDGKLTPGGTYQFRVQVKLLPGEPEAAANVTLREVNANGQASFRWLTESVPLSSDEWTELVTEPFTYDADKAVSTAIYIELDHPTASFLVDHFEITGDQPMDVPFAAQDGAESPRPFRNTRELPSLKEIYADRFLVGFATGLEFFQMEEMLAHHYNALTPGNEMKWASVQPAPGRFNFTAADLQARFAEEHGMKLIGHTLVWHAQTPGWVWEHPDGRPRTREEGLELLEEHIRAVAGRYAGRIYQWDVVNEAVEQHGGVWQLRDSPWLRVIGEDYIEHAFRIAHEADPNALLFYNDYSTTDPGKRDRIYQLAKDLLDKGVPIHGIGMQGHWSLYGPSPERIRAAIEKFASLGLKVSITELDVSVYEYSDRSNRYPTGLPETLLHQQAERYAELFRIFDEYQHVIDRVTFWGTTDLYSWLNHHPEPNRPDHPLLFDRVGEPKPAFWAVVDPYRPWYVTRAEYMGAVVMETAEGEEVATLVPGRYSLEDLKAQGLAFEKVQRLSIERGHVVTFYETADFQGSSWAYSGTAPVDGRSLLDRAKSMVVEYVEVSNVAAGKEVTANAQEARAPRAVDGDRDTSWSPSSGAPYWLQVDLGEEHTLYRWVAKLEGSSTIRGGPTDGPLNASDFELQVSRDGAEWTTIDQVVGNTQSITDRTIQPVVARYVRLYVTKPTSLEFNQNLVVYELEVYGTPLTGAGLEGEASSPEAVAPVDPVERFRSVRLARPYKPLGYHNPIMAHRFGADPYAMVYGDRVYVYSTNDTFARDAAGNIVDNHYGHIRSINRVSSADLVNWTDHGWIDIGPVGSGKARWAGNSWAPAATYKTIDGEDRFFLYFANSGNGIGVLTSDNPVGPWVDPIGRPLVSRSVPNANVVWLFDPAVVTDDEGVSYLYFGGGVPEGRGENPGTARVVELGPDMISLAGIPRVVEAPWFFEAAFVNKIAGRYYYSYMTNWESREGASGPHRPGAGQIVYMTSDSPLGPWEYQGMILDNPGRFFGSWGNNHHSIVEFQGGWYIFYHTQTLQDAMGVKGGYRSTHVDRITLTEDGRLLPVRATRQGVAQLRPLDPYQRTEAETMAWSAAIETLPTKEPSAVFGDVNMVVAGMSDGSWLGVAGVDFGSRGPGAFTAKVASVVPGNWIKIAVDRPDGKVISFVEVPVTGGLDRFQEVTVEVEPVTGVHDLFFVFAGDGFYFDAWEFEQ
jgi:Beta-1,4-xylanase